MRRYWIPGVKQSISHIEISGDEFHHIFKVCRQVAGSKFEILSEDGYALLVEVQSVKKKSALAEVIESRKIARPSKPYIHLAISLPKIDTFEKVLEKSVELGVHTVRPFFSDYSFAKSTKILGSKQERMERIIKNATQQTGRGELMKLEPAVAFNEILSRFKEQNKVRGIFAYEGQGGKSLKQELGALDSELEQLWLFVGSEGGFSRQEADIFKEINLFPVSLGHQVLRVETACVTLLGIIKYELGLF